MPSLTIATPVLPGAAQFLPDAAHSVRAVERHLAARGWDCEWVLVVDGPGSLPKFVSSERTNLIRLPKQSGVAAARNRALAAARGQWLVALDADDMLVPPGLADLLSHPGMESVSWVAANRVTTENEKTAHWIGSSRMWAPGELASAWTAPFPFHPGSVAVRRDAALAVGGWPAVGSHEDLGFVLALGETFRGASVTHVTMRGRLWDGQLCAAPEWAAAKKESFWTLAAMVNARRAMQGRGPVSPPDPGQAYGRVTI